MNIALVGCGHIAATHVNYLKRIRGVDVVAVCDLDLKRAQSFASLYRIPAVFSSASSLIQQQSPDSVHVLTSPQSHLEVTRQVAGKCRAILVEKPLASSTEDARQMVTLAKRNSTLLGVCHNYLCLRSVRAAQVLVKSGALGNIQSADLYWRMTSFSSSSRTDAFKWASELPGGAFHEVAPHPIYLLQAILGDLQFISSSHSSRHYSTSELHLMFRFDENQRAALTISLHNEPIQKYLIIRGDRMSLNIDLGTDMLIKLSPHGAGAIGRGLSNIFQAGQIVAGTAKNVLRSLGGGIPSTHLTFFQDFYQAVENGSTLPASGDDGVRVAEVLDEVWAS